MIIKKIYRVAVVAMFFSVSVILPLFSFPQGTSENCGISAGFEYFSAGNFREENSRLSVSFPLANICGFRVSDNINFSNSHFDKKIYIDNSHLIDNLRDLGTGISAENDRFSFSADINSPSDRVFNSSREIVLSLSSFYKLKKNNSMWMLGFVYNSKEEYKILPLIGYSYQSEKWIMMLPIMCVYNISERWFVKFSGEGFAGFDFSCNYRFSQDLTVSGCANMSQKKFYISERTNNGEFLKIDKNTAGIKIEKSFSNALAGGIYLGKSFSSKYSVEDFDNKYFTENIKNATLSRIRLDFQF